MAGRGLGNALGTGMTSLAAGALAICLALVAGLVLLIAARGLGYFWQAPVEQYELADGTRVLGEVWNWEPRPDGRGRRVRLAVGNRDLTGADFRWIDESEITRRERPTDAGLFERLEWGKFYGFPVELRRDGRATASGAAVWTQIQPLLAEKAEVRGRIAKLHRREIDDVSRSLESIRVELRHLQRQGSADPGRTLALEAERAEQQRRYEALLVRLRSLEDELLAETLVLRAADGSEVQLPAGHVVRAVPANRLGFGQRVGLYVSRLAEFLLDDPRESNTEGGIFPAIFGTVMMVFLTSLAVTPLGVLAAIYLREYARDGPFVRLVRISVNSLAGVPSIVFGVFGLGFFVYLVGGSIDQVFYSERLPAPTFGTGGILWASLTLALLTVPVVIVSTEEGLTAVPRRVREGSYALGATKFETLRRVIVPAAVPGVLTGIILAMARAAGEVAPLMIVGMVKLAPSLPIDGHFPFAHLERKFMHLGFHIYDVGFQSPNVEAVQPLVFATALLLILVVLSTNLAAILLRNRLRRKYASSGV